MSDWRNNPAKYKDWLEWAMSILPAEKGPQCNHEDTPVGTASRRGANEAQAAMSAAPRDPQQGIPTGRNPELGDALPWASRSKVQPVLDVEILAGRVAS